MLWRARRSLGHPSIRTSVKIFTKCSHNFDHSATESDSAKGSKSMHNSDKQTRLTQNHDIHKSSNHESCVAKPSANCASNCRHEASEPANCCPNSTHRACATILQYWRQTIAQNAHTPKYEQCHITSDKQSPITHTPKHEQKPNLHSNAYADKHANTRTP